MRILLTNDDGIFAPGILSLTKWAMTLGEVTVVAPKCEQSGRSHGIEFVKPYEIKRVKLIDGVEAYSCDSTPADCVRFGITGLKRKYDLVLSGINRGVNLGVDIIYSGTVAAIFEAAYWNVNAIALSTYPDSGEYAASQLDAVYNYIKENNLFDFAQIYNVNIPRQSNGLRITKQGSPYFDDGFERVEGDLFIQTGKRVEDEFPDDESRDTVAFERGFTTLTPLTLNRTDLSAFEKLTK